MKKIKLFPILLAASLLASCSGNQTGLRAPKDFVSEGKEVSFKEGSEAFVKKLTDAKFGEWKYQNFSISESTYTKSSASKSHSKATIYGKRYSESCDSMSQYVDTSTQSTLSDSNFYFAVYDDGNEYNSESKNVEDISYSAETNNSDMEIDFVEGSTLYHCSPSSKTYKEETITGFSFEEAAKKAYAEVIVEYDVPEFAIVLAALSGSSEDVYKSTWREYLVDEGLFPEKIEKETFKLKQNDKVFTLSLEQTRNYDNSGFQGTLTVSSRVQIILDAECYTMNFENTQNVDATGQGLSADDKVKFSSEYYEHFAKWIDMGGSVEKPKLENFTKITVGEK